MVRPSDVHTLTEFKRRSTELLDRLIATRRPKILTVEGRPRAVLVDVATYESLSALIDDSKTLDGIRKGIEDVRTGRTRTTAGFARAVRRRIVRTAK